MQYNSGIFLFPFLKSKLLKLKSQNCKELVNTDYPRIFCLFVLNTSLFSVSSSSYLSTYILYIPEPAKAQTTVRLKQMHSFISKLHNWY